MPRRPGCFSFGYSGEAGGEKLPGRGSVLSSAVVVVPSAVSCEAFTVEWVPASDLSPSLKGSRTKRLVHAETGPAMSATEPSAMAPSSQGWGDMWGSLSVSRAENVVSDSR